MHVVHDNELIDRHYGNHSSHATNATSKTSNQSLHFNKWGEKIMTFIIILNGKL